jgi:hypothetical protein
MAGRIFEHIIKSTRVDGALDIFSAVMHGKDDDASMLIIMRAPENLQTVHAAEAG